MVVFTSVDPNDFIPFIGTGGLQHVKELKVFNLCSFDIRPPKVSKLMPSVPPMSQEAYINHDSVLFEREYYHYLDSDESAFLDLMKIIMPEFYDGNGTLTLVEILPSGIQGSFFCDSVVETLISYIYLAYGIQPQIVKHYRDVFNLRPEYSVFSPEGLMLIDKQIPVLQSTCPELLQ